MVTLNPVLYRLYVRVVIEKKQDRTMHPARSAYRSNYELPLWLSGSVSGEEILRSDLSSVVKDSRLEEILRKVVSFFSFHNKFLT